MNNLRAVAQQKLFVSQAIITHSASMCLMQAAIRHAEQLGIKINVAVVDSTGTLVGFLRVPGSFSVSSEMACRKARSAAGLGFDAQTAESILGLENARVREAMLLHPDFTLVRGGLPVYVQGELIGAVGVSGGTEAQDDACVKAALAAVLNLQGTNENE